MTGWLPQTLKARATLILCCLFIISHAVSLILYETNRGKTILLTEATDLSARIAGIVTLARSFPKEDRQQILAAAETQFLAMFPESPVLRDVACQENAFSVRMSQHLNTAFADLSGFDADVCLRSLGTPRGLDVLVSIRFPDREKAVFHAVLPEADSLLRDSVLIHLIFTSMAALFLAWYLIRKAVMPLDDLARAADGIGINIDVPALREDGPREVALAARAFNRMQVRLRRLVHGQTEMIAAISHDLRSAVTRLQLRAELLHDDHERRGMLRVVTDMRLMIQSVIDFVRGIDANEKPKNIDITALVESLCEDLSEEGYPISYRTGDHHCRLQGRPTALRRGIQNIIDNAIKYGGSAQVSLTCEEDFIVLRVVDQGPGVPENKLDSVLRPFYRLEKSRSQDTGGVGLGLAIAQNIIQAHGGVITLANRKEGGLLVEIRLSLRDGYAKQGSSGIE